MSENLRKKPAEGEGHKERSSHENRNRSRYQSEGFEGMNYEQRRPAYSPQVNRNTADHDRVKGKRPDQV